jgi:flagellar basal-body rod protein FlgB
MPFNLTKSDGIPALERMVQFTGQRQRVILDNIANLSTPGFRPRDVSPEAFQAQLREAIDAKRRGLAAGSDAVLGLKDDPLGDPIGGWGVGSALGVDLPMASRARDALPLQSTREVQVEPDGLVLHPEPMNDNILFHDGNDRSVERVMQSLVENFMAFRASAQLLRSRLDLINTAIRERI